MRTEAYLISKNRQLRLTENEKGLLLERMDNGRVLNSRQIFRLNKKPGSEFEQLGPARGQDLFHCIYLASRHGKIFDNDEVVAYFINDRLKNEKYKIEVFFYKKNSR